MPRIRYLKPDFFLDEDIAELPHSHRLAFQGLWCYADREGRLEDSPRKLKALIFPYEEIDMNKVLDDLTKKPFIHRYKTEKKGFIQILTFTKHQRPHHTEKHSEIPAPEGLNKITVKEPLKDGEKKEGMGMEKGMEKGMGMEKKKKKGIENEASPLESKPFLSGDDFNTLKAIFPKRSDETALRSHLRNLGLEDDQIHSAIKTMFYSDKSSESLCSR